MSDLVGTQIVGFLTRRLIFSCTDSASLASLLVQTDGRRQISSSANQIQARNSRHTYEAVYLIFSIDLSPTEFSESHSDLDLKLLDIQSIKLGI